MNNQEFTTAPDAKSFSFSFRSSKSADTIFELLLNIDKWWSGFYSESITGKSRAINDEFSFSAGGGLHYTKQKLVELVPNKKIVWLVTESNLRFLTDTNEWTNTKICFDISSDGDTTTVAFTHNGLLPQIECYDQCSSAWTQYLVQLQEKLK
jgi:hypothetical protein